MTNNKTSQIVLAFFGIVATLLFMRSVMADWSEAQKDGEIITETKATSYWLLNSDGKSQKYTKLVGSGRNARAIELLNAYGYFGDSVWDIFIYSARVHRVYPEVILCITYADTSIGKRLKTKRNWGNVGNNDRGDTVGYANLEQGIDAIGDVLNNRYLGKKTTIGDLSPYSGGVAPFYATSPENREINVLNCLGMIHNKKINSDFAFRR